jgi:hypothetical protein
MHVHDLTKNHTRATASLVSVACGRGGGGEGKGVGLLGHVQACTFFTYIQISAAVNPSPLPKLHAFVDPRKSAAISVDIFNCFTRINTEI